MVHWHTFAKHNSSCGELWYKIISNYVVLAQLILSEQIAELTTYENHKKKEEGEFMNHRGLKNKVGKKKRKRNQTCLLRERTPVRKYGMERDRC